MYSNAALVGGINPQQQLEEGAFANAGLTGDGYGVSLVYSKIQIGQYRCPIGILAFI